MKIIKQLSVLVIVFLLFTLVGCNSFNGVKKDFEKAGYTYNEEETNQINDLIAELEDNNVAFTPHFFSKGLNFPIVLEFKSTQEMNEQIEKSETIKGFLQDLEKSDYVRGNCLLIPFGVNQIEMVNAFQGIETKTKK